MPELVLSTSLDLTPWRGESTGVVESPMSPVCVKIANGNTLGSVPRKGASQGPTTFRASPKSAARAAKPVASVGLVTGITRSRLDKVQAMWKAPSMPALKLCAREEHGPPE